MKIRGKLIAIEGIDQSGKMTQTMMLTEKLSKQGYKVKSMSFPIYNTPIGKLIKRFLNKDDFLPKVSHMLLSANRWEFEETISNELTNNDFLICNRYFLSNLAYGLAHDLDKKWLENLDYGLPKPDIIILIDIPISESGVRKTKSRDKYEKNKKFLRDVRNEYKLLANTKKWFIVNGKKDKVSVSNDIWKIIKKSNKI
jgi:dTMP kinase